jgi:ribosome biogenesis GTPase A
MFDFSRLNGLNWFPGHMASSLRQMRNHLAYGNSVNLVIEVRDARCPLSSRNALLQDQNLGSMPRLIVYNKSDLALADERTSQLCSDGLLLTLKKPKDVHKLLAAIQTAIRTAPVQLGRQSNALILGIPNVGKSTLINALRAQSGFSVGKKAEKTGALPGVTRQLSGTIKISATPPIYLIDTPGIGWPKIQNVQEGLNVALTGGLFDKALGMPVLAEYMYYVLSSQGRVRELETAGYPVDLDASGFLAGVARRIGALKAKGELDVERTASFLLKQFRAGKLGRITLD